MSRAVVARRVTAARSPETVRASTNIRLPSTGSVTSKSISSRHGSWPSARTAWGRVETAAARATAAITGRKLHGLFLRLSLLVPLMLSLSVSARLGLPNQRWGRKGIRPPAFSRLLRLGRRLRRAFPVFFAISRNGPGPPFTGWTGMGGSLLTSWDAGPT